jgi:2',3'-cyclic-nucleotide 2'-phosphodiesterase (5'-nucleotidase family)
MMKFRFPLFLLLIVALLSSCGGSAVVTDIDNEDVFKFTILQINDVYEIAPLQNGEFGGMARVATLDKELIAENPNTIGVLSGDFVSPSLIGTLTLNEQKIAGLQMIECIGAAGIDYVTFGNHEFDIKEDELQRCLDASTFDWTTCNAFQVTDSGEHAPFEKNGVPVPEYIIHEFKAGDVTLKLGLIGVVLPFNKADYVYYDPFISKFRQTYEALKEQCDLVIGITHLDINDDLELAKAMPEVPLLLGGHDHHNMIERVGNVRVTKADANAKTAYVHHIGYNRKTGEVKLQSELRNLNRTVDLDPDVDAIVQRWNTVADSAMSQMGYNSHEVLYTTTEPLNGLESSIRSGQTNLGRMIAASMKATSPTCEIALMNSGSIRVDDVLEGELLVSDVLRTLPFGGGVSTFEISGADLLKVLEIGGTTNINTGGYLQLSGIKNFRNSWEVNDEPLDLERIYFAVGTSFLMSGKEANLGMMADFESIEVEFVGDSTRNDIRDIFMEYLRHK